MQALTMNIADQLFEIAERLADADRVRPARAELSPSGQPVRGDEPLVCGGSRERATPKRARPADRARQRPSERIKETRERRAR